MSHEGKILDSKGKFSVVDCNVCHFCHLSPFPTDEEIDAFYREQYYSEAKKDYFQEEDEEKDFLELIYRERLQSLSTMTNGRRLLDVGCGSGHFLQYATQEHGYDGKGIEPSSLACKVAAKRGLDVFHGSLDSYIESHKEQFDIIVSKNVLEHVLDPVRNMAWMKQLLAPGGVIYVEVPNDFNPVQEWGVRRAGEERSWICIPDHINYFRFRSLENLGKRLGLKPVFRDTTFPMYIFLVFGMNFIKNKTSGKKAHQIRRRFELGCAKYKLNWIKHFLYRLLARCGLGRTAIIYFKAAE